MQRVRVLAEPPTTYQRWLLWGDRWHAEAGEQISYLPGSHAMAIGLPLDAVPTSLTLSAAGSARALIREQD